MLILLKLVEHANFLHNGKLFSQPSSFRNYLLVWFVLILQESPGIAEQIILILYQVNNVIHARSMFKLVDIHAVCGLRCMHGSDQGPDGVPYRALLRSMCRASLVEICARPLVASCMHYRTLKQGLPMGPSHRAPC